MPIDSSAVLRQLRASAPSWVHFQGLTFSGRAVWAPIVEPWRANREGASALEQAS
jgi:hypothetical protein